MIYYITKNQGKFQEASAIIPGLKQLAIDLPEIQETDPHKIIQEKLLCASKELDGDFIVEDVSLGLEGLGGLPGPMIKWFEKILGIQGFCDLAKKIDDNRAFVKVSVGVKIGNKIDFFDAVVKGKIVDPRGKNGFSWDPIFQPEGHNKTYAEMTFADKTENSVRRMVLEKVKKYLK